jgi:hypothetical protein
LIFAHHKANDNSQKLEEELVSYFHRIFAHIFPGFASGTTFSSLPFRIFLETWPVGRHGKSK